MQYIIKIRLALLAAWTNIKALFEPPEKRRRRLITRAAGQAPYNIDQLLAEYGIAPVADPPAPITRTIEPDQLKYELDEHDAKVILELAETQSEIGHPGTYMTGNRVDIEPNAKYRPYKVRGFASRPGDYEDYYRQEPIIRHSVDSVTEVQVSAKRDVQMPAVVGALDPAIDDDELVDDLQKWCEWADGKLQNMATSMHHYVTHATSSVATFGFALFEVVWDWDDEYERTNGESGRVWPKKLAYREPSTVDEWIMNERQDALAAVKFRTGGQASGAYTLTATGPRIEDHRVILCRVAGRGNNWEGISPIRPAMHWIRFKQLLGQIAAATAQKYGVPTTFLRRDPAYEGNHGTDQNDAGDAQAVLAAKQAVEAAVVLLPDGIISEIESPQGAMPSFHELIKYCDDQSARGFSNEGSLLGHNQVGSYALAEVQDNAFMRSAPHWDRIIMEPVNGLLRAMCQQEFGELRAYPTMGFRLDAMHDTGAQIKDMVQLHGGQPVSTWTEPARQWAAEKMGLDPEAFDPEGDEPEPTGGSPSPTPPPEEGDDDDSVPALELTEQQVARIRSCSEHFEATAEDIQKFMDRVEGKLARKFARIAEDQRKWFRDQTQDLVDNNNLTPQQFADRLEQAKDEAKRRFEPEYKEAARASAGALMTDGARRIVQELGIKAPRNMSLPELPDEVQAQVNATINKIADEASARNAGHMRDQRVQQKAGNKSRSVKRLKTSTLGVVANKLGGRAFNAGRDAVVSTARAVLGKKTGKLKTDAGPVDIGDIDQMPRVTCVRTSMLDDDVCEECRSRDFQQGGKEYIVGSGAYYSDMPPEPCLGGERCRCAYLYDAPPEMVEAVKQLVGANFAIGDVLNTVV